MKTIIRAGVTAAAFLISGSSLANDHQIQWSHPDFPPMYIFTGPLKGTGFAEKQIRYMQDLIPEYKHVNVYTDFVTVMGLYLRKENICGMGTFRTKERENVLLFSEKPYGRLLPSGVLIKKHKAASIDHLLETDGRIDINKLLVETDLRFGFTKGRRYGGVIDEFVLLNADYAPDRFWNREVKPSDSKNFQLLENDRLDVLFGYPYEIAHYQQTSGSKSQFIYIPIKDMPSHVDTYIVCSKTPWGKARIAHFNTLIERNEVQLALGEFYLEWLSPKQQQLYHQLMY